MAFYAITHVVSSLLKGCLAVVSVFLIGLLVFLAIKSTKEPVIIFDSIVIENLEIRKVME